MNQIIIALLLGMGVGLVLLPVFVWIIGLIRNTIERRKIKKEISKGNFLITIDPKDYDTKNWKEIDSSKYASDLANLDNKIFKRKVLEETNEVDVIMKAQYYLKVARESGYEDIDIINEFKKKNYSEELIKRILT